MWVFSENNIWAVGFLSSKDTVIDGKKIYNTNIIRWTGSDWKLLPYSGTTSGIYGIWAQDSSTIYFANGLVFKYKNGTFIEYDFTHLTFSNNQSINKLWGSSENNIYGVGKNGIIVHYDGIKWTKINFDTQWRFDAITGSKQSGIAYASATNQSFSTAIIKLENNTAGIIYNSVNDNDHFTSFSIKLLNEGELLLGLNKVWKFNINTKQTELLYTLPSGYGVFSMAIYSNKDIYFFVDPYGSGKELLHYNGKRFTEITFSNNPLIIYGDAYAIKDLAVLTGFSNNKAYLVKVKRR